MVCLSRLSAQCHINFPSGINKINGQTIWDNWLCIDGIKPCVWCGLLSIRAHPLRSDSPHIPVQHKCSKSAAQHTFDDENRIIVSRVVAAPQQLRSSSAQQTIKDVINF